METLSKIVLYILLFSPHSVLASFSKDCVSFSSLLPGKVFSPNSHSYDASISSYFFLGARMTPDLVIAPTTAEEVAVAVKALRSCNTKQVAIRSGGHSPHAGFSNTDHGVTLDLRGLNQIHLHRTRPNVVSVGTGALWIDVYALLDPLEQTVLGARSSSVGVGGFITGGGLSFASPERGFACDNIINMQVVLANGTIINANATSNQELFRAIKGGQNNFGVVTRFDLMTYAQPLSWGGAIHYPTEADTAQLTAFEAFKRAPYDPLVSVEQTFVYFGIQKTFSSTNNLFYNHPSINASALRYFTEIKPQTSNTMRISKVSDFADEIQQLQPLNQFAIYSTVTFRISSDVLAKVHRCWKKSTSRMARFVPNVTSVLTFQSIPPPPGPNSAPNSFPFPPSSAPEREFVLVLFSIYWPSATDSKFIKQSVKDLTTSVEQLVGDGVQYKYLNYAAPWQDALGSYGETIGDEMKRVAKSYDPTGFFQFVVRGGFKFRK